VRRARHEDREAVLGFASRTWDGWDYIPEAWDPWLAAPDGVVLVAVTTGPTRGADGGTLEAGRPVALARVALLAPGEAWLEGIRVDPAVRGRDVVTNLQVAELAWCRALGARVVRYATHESNEGSHRLGARHGFRLLCTWRSYGQPDDVPAQAGGPRAPRLARDADAADLEHWWRFVAHDPVYALGAGLYEWRGWAVQALTRERFEAHVRADEVVLAADGGALGILPRIGTWAEETDPHLALLVGNGGSALRLLAALEAELGRPVRVRLPDPEPTLLAGEAAAAWHAAGYWPHEHTLHMLGRGLAPDELLPAARPEGILRLDEPPRAAAVAPVIGA
jgi:hypothetical protein